MVRYGTNNTLQIPGIALDKGITHMLGPSFGESKVEKEPLLRSTPILTHSPRLGPENPDPRGWAMNNVAFTKFLGFCSDVGVVQLIYSKIDSLL